LRDQLLGELGSLGSQEAAAAWARRALVAKNTLTTADASVVETAFAARLAGFADDGLDEGPLPYPPGHSAGDPEIARETADTPRRVALLGALRASVGLSPAKGVAVLSETPAAVGKKNRKKRARQNAPSSATVVPNGTVVLPAVSSGPEERVNNAVAWRIDKSALTHSEPRRYRDRAHLEFVASQPCLLCGRRPSDPHHLRFAQPRALGRRVSDEFVVPLCRTHHRVLHRQGDEAAWWESVKLDPVSVARRLWEQTRLNGAPVHRNIGTSPSAPLVRDLEDGTLAPPVGPADR
jgi:hypothetical protein